jgi:hypothetical protein
MKENLAKTKSESIQPELNLNIFKVLSGTNDS